MEEKKPTEQEEYLDPNDFDEDAEEQTRTDNEDVKDNDSKEPNDSKSDEELEKEKEAKKNSHFAELRRKKEAEAKAKAQLEQEEREKKIREEATLKAELNLLKRNPYTNEPIEDEEDLKIYKLQKELDDEGKDPISDLPKKLAEENRKARKDAESKSKAQKEKEQEEYQKLEKEYNDLVKKYPDVKVDELANDPIFLEVIKGKYGRWTQIEMYEAYLVEKSKRQESDKQKKVSEVAEEKSKSMSKTPSSSASGKATSKKVEDMSKDEFETYWRNKYGS